MFYLTISHFTFTIIVFVAFLIMQIIRSHYDVTLEDMGFHFMLHEMVMQAEY